MESRSLHQAMDQCPWSQDPTLVEGDLTPPATLTVMLEGNAPLGTGLRAERLLVSARAPRRHCGRVWRLFEQHVAAEVWHASDDRSNQFYRGAGGAGTGTVWAGLTMPGAEAPKRPGPAHRVPAHTFFFWAGFEARCMI